MDILPFGPVYYDKRDREMKAKDMSRPDDFIEISGTKMRTCKQRSFCQRARSRHLRLFLSGCEWCDRLRRADSERPREGQLRAARVHGAVRLGDRLRVLPERR